MVNGITNQSTPVNTSPTDNTITEKNSNFKKSTTTPQDTKGAPSSAPSTGAAPVLEPPKMDTAHMMILLTALQSKNTDAAIKQGELLLEGNKKEIKDKAETRMQELSTYFDNLEKGASTTGNKMGLFGFIGKFFKSLFQGNLKEAFKDLASNIGTIIADAAKLIACAISIVLASVATAVSAGAGTPFLALAILGTVAMVSGMILADPVVVNAIIETLPEDSKQGAMMGLMIAGLVLQLAGGIMMVFSNPKAAADVAWTTAKNLLLGLSGIASGIGTAVTATKEYNAAEHRVAAQENQAHMDEIQAEMTKIQALMNRNTEDMKALMEILTSIMSSTGHMLGNVAHGYSAVAQA